MTETVLTHLDAHAAERPDDPAFAAKLGDEWIVTTWSQYRDLVRQAGRAFLALGLKPGGTVGILAFNRPEWAIGCLGATAAGGVPVGIYQTCAPNQVGYIVGHAESRVVIVEDAEQWQKVRQVRGELPALKHVVLMAGAEIDEPDPMVLSWEDLMAGGLEVPESELDGRLRGLESGDLATLIYTSGTTGTPKAVMLSHGNLVETCRIYGGLHRIGSGERLISYLPLAHIAEQMLSVQMAAYVGYAIYYAESVEKLAQNIVEVEPTIFFGVPRVWERVHSAVAAKLQAATGLRGRLAAWALGVGRRAARAWDRGEPLSGLSALRHRLAERLVLSKVRARLGFRRLVFGASGAAPINREVLDFFAALGVYVYEVYGLSESCGPGTWNHAGKHRLGTVGPAPEEVEVRIADDGEVLFRGPNVFQGYYKDPEATAEALVDGWLRSGDLGALDGDGFLTITGRKKELIITSGGKNIAPAGIEAALKDLELIAEAVVIGDGRRFLSALLTLDGDAVARFASEQGATEPFHEDPRITAEVERGVEEVNRRFARVETVRKFRILPRNFTLEDGELTPTLKIKRRVVAERWAEVIEEMYVD